MQIIFPEINASEAISLEEEGNYRPFRLTALQVPSEYELNALVDDCVGVSAISKAVLKKVAV